MNIVAEPREAKNTSGSGVVLASYGRGVLAQADGAEADSTLRCSLKGRKLRIVCSDRITWSYSRTADGPTVDSIEPRRNLIERIDARGRAEPVVANIDCLAIVVATEPVPDWFLVDRYWAAAQLKDIATLLIINKLDLGHEALESEIATYEALSLACLRVAAHSGLGVASLTQRLERRVTLLVGQSGVGKSSIVNSVVPLAAAQTAELTRDAEGRHATTTARRYRLGPESALVDAPGVRDFAPPASLVNAAERGFVEIHAAAKDCKFNDCRHLEEPGCAVRTAVAAGGIAARRYESYRRLFRLYERFDA